MALEERRKNSLIPFEEKAVKEYLDNAIRCWRKRTSANNTRAKTLAYVDVSELEEEDFMARCYVDAFQSVRMTLFGELLPK